MTETTLSSVEYQLLSISIIVNCIHCNSRKQGIFGSAATLGGRYFWDSTVFVYIFVHLFIYFLFVFLFFSIRLLSYLFICLLVNTFFFCSFAHLADFCKVSL